MKLSKLRLYLQPGTAGDEENKF